MSWLHSHAWHVVSDSCQPRLINAVEARCTSADMWLCECRVYRGAVTSQQDTGIYFTSHGGSTSVRNVEVHAMGTIWTKAADQPAKAFEPAEGRAL